jgi:hypothetical protein
MAFGLMQQKWGILHCPVGCSMQQAKWLIHTIARLHNYTINRRVISTSNAPQCRVYLPNVLENNDGQPINNNGLYKIIAGNSVICEHMVDRVRSLGSKRPIRNTRKRKGDDKKNKKN